MASGVPAIGPSTAIWRMDSTSYTCTSPMARATTRTPMPLAGFVSQSPWDQVKALTRWPTSTKMLI